MSSDVLRLRQLEVETEALLERLRVRAEEFYRQESGRTHFHSLRYLWTDDDTMTWETAIRGADLKVEIPLRWFL